jgi:hypothetical protein
MLVFRVKLKCKYKIQILSRLASGILKKLNRENKLYSYTFAAAVGDWGCNSNTNSTVNNVLDKKPELVLGLGDYSYNITSDDCWFKIVDPIDYKMKIAIGQS